MCRVQWNCRSASGENWKPCGHPFAAVGEDHILYDRIYARSSKLFFLFFLTSTGVRQCILYWICFVANSRNASPITLKMRTCTAQVLIARNTSNVTGSKMQHIRYKVDQEQEAGNPTRFISFMIGTTGIPREKEDMIWIYGLAMRHKEKKKKDGNKTAIQHASPLQIT